MFAIKLLITIVVFVIIAYNIDLDTLWQILLSADLVWLLGAFFLQCLVVLLAALRWSWLMAKLSFNFSHWFYIKHYWVGLLLSQAMPSSIGGDVYRVAVLARQKHTKTNSFYAVLLDRVMGFLALLLVIATGLLFSQHYLSKPLLHAVLVLLGLGVLAILLLWFVRYVNVSWPSWLVWLPRLSKQFRQSLVGTWHIARQLFVSMAIHILATVIVYCIAQSLHWQQAYWSFLLFVPIALLFTMVPISFAGWGVREGAMVFLFALVGGQTEVVLGVSVIYGLLVIVSSLPASYLFLKK